MTGVTYTGNYQTVDDYNPYKYTSQAPFGSEDYQPEPLNMQGAVGVLVAIAGFLILTV